MQLKKMITLLMNSRIGFFCCQNSHPENQEYSYQIHKLKQSMPIDANWDKVQWQRVPVLSIHIYMGERPEFQPKTQVKVLYDDAYLYLIFWVEDQFVRTLAQEIHGQVWEDACVEFFFAPFADAPLKYFNLEMNCGGTALMHYNREAGVDYTPLAIEDMQQIEIVHSLPKIIDPEIIDPVVWTLEYRLPMAILEKYSPLTRPEKGVVWRANFQKCAENNSHPHWLTWAKIDYPTPRFHMPEFFGKIEFVD